MNLETSRSLLQRHDFNVIFVDWSAGAQTISYFAARGRIRDVARVLSAFISEFEVRNSAFFYLKISRYGAHWWND